MDNKIENLLALILENQTAMQNKLNSFRDDVDVQLKGVNIKLDKLNNSMESVYDQTADLTEFRTMVDDKLSIVKDDVKFVKHKD